MSAFCLDDRRRDLVLQTPGWTGLDYLEVLGAAGCGTQLALTFLKDARSLGLTADNIVITGDTVVQATGVQPATNDDPYTVTVTLNQTGDFSPYTLTLVKGKGYTDPPPAIDSQLAAVTFSFKAACVSPTDCQTSNCCPAAPIAAPDIHYLARDYDGFRQAMIDRMAALLPSWSENHEADPGITMIEALAYTADRVSYLQDAVNTEAYIGTARSRISLRRHARLVDYYVQEGSNARAWVCLTASQDGVVVPMGTRIYPLVTGLPAAVDPDSYAGTNLINNPSGPVFESLSALTVFVEQNSMNFYTWGNGQCCLPAGTTQATLDGVFSSLEAGDVLIFQEALGPLTGDPADADPTHRWAVRLTSATTIDESGNSLQDPTTTPPTLLTNIVWQSADALPFPLCLSSVTDAAHGSLPISGVSVALGNVLAADQGVWPYPLEQLGIVPPFPATPPPLELLEGLGTVPPLPPAPVANAGCNCSAVGGAAAPLPKFNPTLANSSLTFAVAFDPTAPASLFLSPDVSTATPQIQVYSDDGSTWTAVEDLLDEESGFTGFIPEIEYDSSVHLRFGDGAYGAAPVSGVSFAALYRTGNGSSGNVGREALAHLLFGKPGISGVRNPLAAAGGTDAETMEHIRQVAPYNFESQLRCVTASDYGTMAALVPGVAEAKGTMRWTGSWYTAFVSVEPTAGQSAALTQSVTTSLNEKRMMGVDLAVEGAILVGLRISLTICVGATYFQGDVYAAVWKVLVGGDPCTGALGLLNPANFQFGETVYSSPIVAAAQAVPGVVAVAVTTFERMDSPTPPGAAVPTQLTMGALEIPRCDNDSNHADRGLLTLTMDGGK